jgi:hypothetical protein
LVNPDVGERRVGPQRAMEERRHGVRIEEDGEPGQRRVDRNGRPATRLRLDTPSLFQVLTLGGYARSSVRAQAG